MTSIWAGAPCVASQFQARMFGVRGAGTGGTWNTCRSGSPSMMCVLVDVAINALLRFRLVTEIISLFCNDHLSTHEEEFRVRVVV